MLIIAILSHTSVLFSLHLLLDSQQLQETFSVKPAMENVSTFLRSCHKKELPPDPSREQLLGIDFINIRSKWCYKDPVPLNFTRIIDIFSSKNPRRQCSVQIHSPSIESSSLVDYPSPYNITYFQKIKAPAPFAHSSHSEP